MKNTITVQTLINAPLAKVWEFWNQPEHIAGWAFASDNWEAPYAENDLRPGGKFKTRMSAKDKSSSFDFAGVYTDVVENKLIEFDLGDRRHVKVEFEEEVNGVRVVETFDPEKQLTMESQRFGWQAILDNFKKYVEGQVVKSRG